MEARDTEIAFNANWHPIQTQSTHRAAKWAKWGKWDQWDKLDKSGPGQDTHAQKYTKYTLGLDVRCE